MYDERGNVNNVIEVQEYQPENLDNLSSFQAPSSPVSSYDNVRASPRRRCTCMLTARSHLPASPRPRRGENQCLTALVSRVIPFVSAGTAARRFREGAADRAAPAAPHAAERAVHRGGAGDPAASAARGALSIPPRCISV